MRAPSDGPRRALGPIPFPRGAAALNASIQGRLTQAAAVATLTAVATTAPLPAAASSPDGDPAPRRAISADGLTYSLLGAYGWGCLPESATLATTDPRGHATVMFDRFGLATNPELHATSSTLECVASLVVTAPEGRRAAIRAVSATGVADRRGAQSDEEPTLYGVSAEAVVGSDVVTGLRKTATTDESPTVVARAVSEPPHRSSCGGSFVLEVYVGAEIVAPRESRHVRGLTVTSATVEATAEPCPAPAARR